MQVTSSIAPNKKRPWWLWIPLMLSWMPAILLTPLVALVWFYYIAVMDLLQYLGEIFEDGSSIAIILVALLLPALATAFAVFAALRAKDSFRRNKWSATIGWCFTAYPFSVLAFFLLTLMVGQ